MLVKVVVVCVAVPLLALSLRFNSKSSTSLPPNHPCHSLHPSPTPPAGPGREILVHGWRALRHGRPDMNTLVGLGATASFAVSCVAAALPRLGWRTFFEEPAMLLGEWGLRGCGDECGYGQQLAGGGLSIPCNQLPGMAPLCSRACE